MAFTVTPTSGVAPYVLDISFAEKNRIDGVNYKFNLRISSSVGSCPTAGTGGMSPSGSVLLANETVSIPTSVAVGSCGTYTAQIVNSSNVVISQSVVNVNNL